MIERSVEIHTGFKLFITSIRNQLFLSASVTRWGEDSESSAEEIYIRIADLLSASSYQIIHERCFGEIGLQPQVLKARAGAFVKYQLETDTPVTFVEGASCLKSKFAGVQIRALKPGPETRVWTILDEGAPRGRAWNLNGSTFYMLHSVDGGQQLQHGQADRKSQSEAMFHHAEQLLRAHGSGYRDVVRTWIYISDILEWYGDFNAARNRCYSEYGFLGSGNSDALAEQMYLPASTGIEGRNPSGSPATMDVFAVHRSTGSGIHIRPIYGVKQRSPFRYGSAFSRAVVVEEPGSKLILVSGTASIDEEGHSVHIGDPATQIRQTLAVISSLIASEDATLQDLCEATLFFKRAQDFPIYQSIAEEAGISNTPSVNVVADVCRDELLFELDAAFILEKKKD